MLEAVGEDIESRVENLQSYDEVHFIWMVSFFTGCQRLNNMNRGPELHSTTASVDSLAVDEVDALEEALERPRPATSNATDEYDVSNLDAMQEEAPNKPPSTEGAKPERSNRTADRAKALRLELLGPVAAGVEFDVFSFIARKLNDCVQDKQWEQVEVALRALKEIVRMS